MEVVGGEVEGWASARLGIGIGIVLSSFLSGGRSQE